MSDIDTTAAEGKGRKEQAKELIGQAGQTLKNEAQSFASAAQDRVRAEAEKGTRTATKTLGDFANAVRLAGDQLAQSDQSPASRLVRQAADGLESLSRSLADKQPEDLIDAVRDFGRKNPAAFIGGAVLVGLAMGRLVRASEPAPTVRLSDESLAFSEETAFEGAAETGTAFEAGRAGADDVDGLRPSDLSSTASPVGVDDGTSGIGETVEPPPRSGSV
jgi:hypothetical protein